MNNNNHKFDIGKMAQNDELEGTASLEGESNTALTPTPRNPAYAVIQHQDLAWIEATQGLQRNLIQSLQEYKSSWADRKAISVQRQRMIAEVTEQYANYLKAEAKMASQAAIQARDSILRQELAKLRAKLFVELADITGTAVVEIERLAQSFSNKLTSPAIQHAYAKFVMSKILALLEQSDS
jgi:uncharacterized membrane-anchored protein YjiN (DUF445 family)